MATINKDFRVKHGLTAGGQVNGPSFKLGTSDETIELTSFVDSWTYSKEFSVSVQETEPRGIEFKSDGTKMFILGNAGNDITEYNLSTAWDIATATAGNTFSVATQDGAPSDITFKSDGTSFYMLGVTADTIYQYDMTVAWDITTATYSSKSFVVAQETEPQGLAFKSDGTKMYVVGTTNDTVYQYSLSTAWDVSTATYDSISFSVSAYDSNTTSLYFSPDGTKMYTAGVGQIRLSEFTLSSAWDVSTATFNAFTSLIFVGAGNHLSGLSGLYVASAQNKAYICDFNNDEVYQFDTNTPAAILKGNKWNVDKTLEVKEDLFVNRNAAFAGNVRFYGGSAVTYNTNIASGNNAFAWSSTTNGFTVTSQTSGAITLGGTSGTGTITLGQSTGTQIVNIGSGAVANASSGTINIGNGATASGGTRTINIGSAGLTGSTTNVTIGSTDGTSTVTINGATTFNSTVSAVDFNSTSDLRLKTNIRPIKGLETVEKLIGVEFDFIQNNMHASGVIAQQIELVLPHIVHEKDGVKSVSYTQIVPYLIEAIKDLSAEVKSLKNQLGYK